MEQSKLYVGNLSYDTTEEDLRNYFGDKGIEAKSVTLIKDKYTGRSKGFGFVEVDSEETIQKAIEALDGQDFGGRKLTVNKAKPRTDRPSGGGSGFGSGGRRRSF